MRMIGSPRDLADLYDVDRGARRKRLWLRIRKERAASPEVRERWEEGRRINIRHGISPRKARATAWIIKETRGRRSRAKVTLPKIGGKNDPA